MEGRLKLYLVRHGIAEDARAGQSDADRRLTGEGRQKLAAGMALLARTGVRPTLIITSPLKRAIETAEIAARELNYKGDLLHSDALAPEASVRDTWEEVRAHKSEDSLLMTSHNPLCSQLAGYLLGAPNLQVQFGKGAVLCVEFDRFGPEAQGTLRFMVSAKFGVAGDDS